MKRFDLYSMKFAVKDSTHSKAIQIELQKLGFRWGAYKVGTTHFENASNLYADVKDMYITYTDYGFLNHYYKNHPNKETTLEDLYMLNSKVQSGVKLENMKFKILDQNQRNGLVTKLTSLGFKWRGKEPFIGGKFVYAYVEDMTLTFGIQPSSFLKHPAKETTIEQLDTIISQLTGVNSITNMKFIVKSQIESEIIQEELFLLGFKWPGDEVNFFQYQDQKFLYADSNNMKIGHGDDYRWFNNNKEYTTTTIEQLYKLTSKQEVEISI